MGHLFLGSCISCINSKFNQTGLSSFTFKGNMLWCLAYTSNSCRLSSGDTEGFKVALYKDFNCYFLHSCFSHEYCSSSTSSATLNILLFLASSYIRSSDRSAGTILGGSLSSIGTALGEPLSAAV